MLNSSEKDHNEVIEYVGNIRDLIHDEEIHEDELDERLNKLINGLTDVTKRVLKREWNIVKKGK